MSSALFMAALDRRARVWATLDPFAEPGAVLGRAVANAGFLRSLAAADPFDEYHFFLSGPGQEADVRALLAQGGPALERRGAARFFSRLDLPGQLRGCAYHAFHLSDCLSSQPHLARLRNLHASEPFPITGAIHSLSYAGHATALLAHLWPGVSGRDAIVCTSAAGQAVVEAYFRELRQAYGLDPARFPQPRLARIPLGVDVDALAPPSPEERLAARAGLGLHAGQAMVLVFGRIQHHSKMDMLPVFRAFQRLLAQGLPPAAVRLTLAGWADESDDFPATLSTLAANLGLPLTMALRPDEPRKRELYAAADVFCSMADNPQETFGLTLLEAGAMGLPVVASDYDGYRELVEQGVTGLLVPTAGPEAGGGGALDALARVLFDNQYHLLLAQRTAVDVPALTDALGRLLADPDGRAAMGRAARRRVEEHFSWAAVVRRHLELWDELWDAPADAQALRAAVHPLHPSYATVFAGHPSAALGPAAPLVWSRAGQAVYRGREFPLVYAGLGSGEDAWADPERLRELLFMARRPAAAGELVRGLMERHAGMGRERAEYLVLWALKQDFLEPAGGGARPS